MRIKSHTYALALFLILLTVIPARGEYFRHLSLDDGLSQPSVIAIQQDRFGRMWFGTREGVNVYDGVSVVAYKGWVDDPAGGGKVWIGNHVSAITSTPAGDLFMVMDYNLVKYDIRADRFVRLTESGNIRALASYESVTTFMSPDSVFAIEDGNDSIRFLFRLPPAANVTHLALDDRMYYISTERGLHVIDRATRRHTMMLENESIYSTFIGRNNALWICAENGGLYRKGLNEQVPSLVSMPEVPKSVAGAKQSRHAVEDFDGRIWYGTFTGLYCYDPASKETRHIDIPANSGGLNHPSVFGMCCDRRGNIWVGTYFGGVNYFSPGRDDYVNFNYEGLAPRGLYHSYINSMVMDNDGSLWFGTDGAGVCCVDSRLNIKKQLTAGDGPNALRQNNIKCLAYDSASDRLFIGTHLGGLSVYDVKKGTTVNLIDNPEYTAAGNVIHALKIYGDRLYISSREGLSYIGLNDRSMKITRLKCGISPYRFDFDAEGNMYASTRFVNRIYRISGLDSQPVTKAFADLGKYGTSPTSICCNADGLLVGTSGNGLMLFPDYKGDDMRVLSTSTSDMPDDYCYTMEKTSDGDVYILTNRYLVRYHSVDMSVESVLFASYFPDSRIIDECGLLVKDNGDILIGSTKGITRMRNDVFQKRIRDEKSPELYFSRLKVYNTPIAPGDGSGILASALPMASEINLPHNRTNLSLSIGLTDCTRAPALPSIEYLLDGNDAHWLTSTNGYISFNSIDPGDYRLRVRSVGDKDEISIRIRVADPWYSSWIAWLFYALAVFLFTLYIWRKNRDAARLRTSLIKEQVERHQIEKLNQEKLVFFTNVSHEFQTPLTLIISHVDLLISKFGRNEKLLETLKSIRRHTLQMSHLITQLLEFRKLQQNHQVLRLAYHDAAESLQQNASPFSDYAVQRNIDYRIEIPEDSHITGFYDSAMIDRVLVNIISNAFKYTSDGGKITCRVRPGKDGTIVFEVSDTGRGISEKDLPYIFDRFYNGTPEELHSSAIDYRSTGIGLAFAKSIVDKHHGEITVKSRRGEGSTFTVVIPTSPKPFAGDENVVYEDESVMPEPEEDIVPIPDISDEETESSEPEDERPLVLIVEDNAELRVNLVKFFENYFRVAEAEDGEDGLAKARSLNPAIIISDVMMPVMDGTEMCRRIKSDLALCHIPIILLTALSTSESTIAGLNANADDYVTKPFESAVLLARVDNLIRNRNILRSQFGRKPVEEINMSVVNPLDRNMIKHITDYIDKHMSDQNLDIPSLCLELGLSRSLFYNKFKSLTGMTPNAFILNYRLKHAAMLLRTDDSLTITEISDRTGFNNAAYFSRCFRKQFGISPAPYRKGGA